MIREDKGKNTAYTYIVECGDGTLYTGWTNRLEERMKCHNEGKGAKYTRSRLPVRLVYYEVFATKQEAMKRECAIKRLSRKDKLALIEGQPEQKENRN
ncbi:MAG: GIY-YIG nuclease family protein [Lachnospiraceae bacterium]